MKLLLDEMYAPANAGLLRARGHDVAFVHDPSYRRLALDALLAAEPDLATALFLKGPSVAAPA